ncbi:MAG: hypothetical protein ACRD4P_17520, partial [Bryobacteraceae bacterium]
MNRRDFSKYVLGGGAALLVPGAAANAAEAAAPAPQQTPAAKFDLLIEGGTVIDPAQNLNGAMDVAVHQGKVLEVSRNIAKDRAAKIVSAKDRIVTPGFIDLHAHCYDGVSIGMNADHFCLSRGVTTVVDAGSAGYVAFPNFRKYVINASTTRIAALVHIEAIGTMMTEGALENLSWADPELTAKMAMDNRPVTVGIKIQLSKAITGSNDIEGLKRAIEAGKIAGLPVMVHIDGPYSPLPDILKLMRK